MRLAYPLLVALTACSPVTAGGSPDGGHASPDAPIATPDAGAPDAMTGSGDFSLENVPVSFTVPVGGFNLLPVHVNRTGGFSGAVMLTLASLPGGVTASPVTVPSGQTDAELHVSGASPLMIGNTFSFQVVGTAGSLTHMTSVQATATGAPGSIDMSFAASATNPGTFQTVIGTKGGPFHDLFVLPDQRILAAGESLGLSTLATGAVVLADGSGLDTGYNSTGSEIFNPCGCSGGAPMEGAARLSNGDYVLVGQSQPSASTPMEIFTMVTKPTGVGDNVWGNVGKDFESVSGGTNIGALGAVVLQNDEIIEVVKRDGDVMLMALAPGGGLDNTFGNGGFADTFMAGPTHASIALDGTSIYVVGTIGTGSNSDLQLMRYNTHGQPDTTFGSGGKVSFGQPNVEEDAVGVIVQPDHKPVILAHANGEFMLVRFGTTGQVDTSFGQQGSSEPTVTDGDDVPVDAKVMADGRIVVVGNTSGGSKPGPVAARYETDGSLDPTFGDSGVSSVFIGQQGVFTSCELQSTDKLVVGGSVSSYPYYSTVTRLWL